MKQIDKKRFHTLLILSAVFLINPNINVVDIMPDFISWFILARLFAHAADSAPYFEEARSSFLKLGWINLAKIPAFFLIITIRTKDTLDNNVFALFSLSFCAVELMFLLPGMKNLFTALFHLGERTDAVALIRPIDSPFSKVRKITPEALKECTYFFFICKGILSFIPDMFMLTSFSDRGTPVAISKHYPYVFIVSFLLTVFVGVIWFLRIKKYTGAVREENKFFDALDSMASENSAFYSKRKSELRTSVTTLTMLSIASLFTLELSFDNWGGINILPHFIYGLMLIISVYCLDRIVKVKLVTYLAGICYVAISIISYAFSILFLSKYEYFDLIDDKVAKAAYLKVEIFGVLEFIFIVAFLLLVATEINKFILNRTGIPTSDKKYGILDKELHSSLKTKSGVLCGLGIFAAATKCANIFLNGDVQILFTSGNAITTSSLPWFNLLVQLGAIAYILFSFYFMSTLKDELKNKYANQL